MAKRVKPAKKARGQNSPKVASGELLTLLDFVRYAVSRFNEAKLAFAHGTTDPVAEAAFLVCEALHLHPDQFESFATARVTAAEGKPILDLIDRRVTTRKPAAYLVNKVYMRGLPFYVDERVIVPRSFIGELLDSHFAGEDGRGASLMDPAERRERARPLHRLGLPRHSRGAAFSECRDRCRRYLQGRARGRRAQCRRPWPGRPHHAASRRPVQAARRASVTTSSSPIRPMSTPRAWPRCRRNAAPSRSSPSTAAPTGSTSSGASWTRPART